MIGNRYALTVGAAESAGQEDRTTLDVGRLLMFGALLMWSFRFLAIPWIVWLSLNRPGGPRRIQRGIAGCLLALALLSPVDIGVPGFGDVRGNDSEGIRVLRVVRGMPADTILRARYGEYVSSRCAGLPCIYQPIWWIVWWK